MFLLINKMHAGDVIQVDADDVRQLDDHQLEQVVKGEIDVIRFNPGGFFERLELVDGVIPSWPEVPSC